MRDTRVIFVEGIPGSGKSTAAQFLTYQMQRQGIPAVWWYEEIRGHPLFVFDDLPSLDETVDKLFSGRHGEVVDAALARWREFAERQADSPGVTVFDSCLFGYMTWGLFPANVPLPDIAAHVAEVERIIAPLAPSVIYLYQDDVGAALRNIVRRRGDVEPSFIRRATECPYGKHHGLEGFDGVVRYWSEFRALADRLFADCPFAKLAIENSAGDWPAYEGAMLAFLDVLHTPDVVSQAEELRRLTGAYQPAGSSDAWTEPTRGGPTAERVIPHPWEPPGVHRICSMTPARSSASISRRTASRAGSSARWSSQNASRWSRISRSRLDSAVIAESR